MDEKDLEHALIAWGKERIHPSEELLQAVRSRRHQEPWLPWLFGISLILQMITSCGSLFLLIFFPMNWGVRLVLFSLLMTLMTLPLGILVFPPAEKGLRRISL